MDDEKRRLLYEEVRERMQELRTDALLIAKMLQPSDGFSLLEQVAWFRLAVDLDHCDALISRWETENKSE